MRKINAAMIFFQSLGKGKFLLPAGVETVSGDGLEMIEAFGLAGNLRLSQNLSMVSIEGIEVSGIGFNILRTLNNYVFS